MNREYEKKFGHKGVLSFIATVRPKCKAIGLNLWLIAISISGDPSYSPWEGFVLGTLLDFPSKFLVLGSFNVCFLFSSLFLYAVSLFLQPFLQEHAAELGAASPWVVILTLFSLDQQEELVMPQSFVWLL